MWNWLTVGTALAGGILVTVDLFGSYHWHALHVVFILMGFLFSRLIASEHTGTNLIAFDTQEQKDKLISKLLGMGMNNTQIFDVVGGDRTRTWARINELRSEME
ncbi:hypothetical protein OSCT_2722 [Oscillochloris trichoides DG-6]|uniref:Uncharacterized protein n=1 Tax=Oscillochloris trichoides DG-6 TaxID=765420 RepID=E1IHC1_9CHLR|nr:hypothetical protein OSCT_2722 [Oscillochloris trichoides DG-6]